MKNIGFYSYNYEDNFEKLNEPRLSARRLWKNILAGGEVSVNPIEYNHRVNVFSNFACRSVGDYHDLYLTTDVLLLASIFEAFRLVCYETYGVDCAHYYTASSLPGDGFLKLCKADLRLHTECDLVQSMISGGMSSVYAKKFRKANNHYLADYDKNKKSS